MNVPNFSVMQSTPPIRTSSMSTGPQYLGHMVGMALLSAIAVVAVALALTGCATNSTAGADCVPRVQIEEATILPGGFHHRSVR